ncbi:uncharacterized protein LOC119104292 [Pollicipes pollicipes]|uniref:uncharacterized protein LOC119104292 n=1 Tax=Pollicipes pollicipes TaxID=41117 RepID=UPI001884E4B8|nr:uncharacterized protein LOC119104292 [Pollicipes pollicipes]
MELAELAASPGSPLLRRTDGRRRAARGAFSAPKVQGQVGSKSLPTHGVVGAPRGRDQTSSVSLLANGVVGTPKGQDQGISRSPLANGVAGTPRGQPVAPTGTSQSTTPETCARTLGWLPWSPRHRLWKQRRYAKSAPDAEASDGEAIASAEQVPTRNTDSGEPAATTGRREPALAAATQTPPTAQTVPPLVAAGACDAKRHLTAAAGGCGSPGGAGVAGREEEDEDIACTQPVTGLVLDGVVAFVDVRSGADNRSEPVRAQLRTLGATVTDRLTKQVTHVVFKDGSKATFDRARRDRLRLVSALWVDACRQRSEHVDEGLYPPAAADRYESPLFPARLRKLRSMQPRDFEEEMAAADRSESHESDDDLPLSVRLFNR